MKSSIVEKVRTPRIRHLTATPKEEEAWNNFLEMARTLYEEGKPLPRVVQQELARLVAKQNPKALWFQEQLERAAYKPRAANETPKPAPPRRRITGIKWG